jgi:hypothetical protein
MIVAEDSVGSLGEFLFITATAGGEVAREAEPVICQI